MYQAKQHKNWFCVRVNIVFEKKITGVYLRSTKLVLKCIVFLLHRALVLMKTCVKFGTLKNETVGENSTEDYKQICGKDCQHAWCPIHELFLRNSDGENRPSSITDSRRLFHSSAKLWCSSLASHYFPCLTTLGYLGNHPRPPFPGGQLSSVMICISPPFTEAGEKLSRQNGAS